MSESRTGGRLNKAPASAANKRTRTKPAAKATASRAKPAAQRAKPGAKAKSVANGARSTAAKLDDRAFQKLRALCLALPDTKLTMTWGSPHFRVGEKIFCGFGADDGKQVLGVKLERDHARTVVKESRFWPAKYVGKHGWVSMDITQRKSWHEVAALIRESYTLIAPKASLAKLR
jgi:predicted DNA-binding protein (MmcQ/YjbR family)